MPQSNHDHTMREEIVSLLPRLRAYAFLLTRNREKAKDLVQDTLVKSLANLARFTPGTNLKAWLYTILRNTFYNNVAREKKEHHGNQALHLRSPAVWEGSPEWHLRLGELMNSIHALAPQYREVFILVVVMGESYEEAATICHCRIGTVKSRLNRARALLSETLD